jgi:hypothetical protein
MFTRTPILALVVSLTGFFLAACGPASVQPTASADRASAGLSASAATAPALGTAGYFSILAGTAVTCTGSTVTGNVGVSPGTSIVQTSCPVTGTLNAGDATAAAAQTDFAVAYAAVAALPCDQTLTVLDGLTLAPGVYCFDAAVTSTGGVLTLNGPATGTWIFKVGTLGTGALTGSNFTVTTPAGTPPPCNSVTWWTAQAATLTDSAFVGNILSGAAATVTRGTFNGNVYAMAAVTLTGAAFTGCGLGGGTGGGADGGVGGGTCTGKHGEDGEDEDCTCEASDDEDDRGSSSRSSTSSGSSQDSEHGNARGEHRGHECDDRHGDGHTSRETSRK